LTLALGVATMDAEMISPWYVLLAGIGGWVANSLLLGRNSLPMPSLRREGGTHRLDVGFVSHVALGVAAAFLPYLFGTETLSHLQQIGLSFLGAIGGASLLGNVAYAEFAASRSAQAAIVRDVTGLEPLARIDRLITHVRDARSAAEVKVFGRELLRQVDEYCRTHPRRV
jgi:hypothetical protein